MIAIPLEVYKKLRLLADEYNIEIPQRITHHDFWIDEDRLQEIISSLELKAVEHLENELIPKIIEDLKSLCGQERQ